MWLTIVGLITGKISVSALSGPVGIYSVVGQSMKYGLLNVIYLVSYLSINVGVINILPFPAFDGGRIFFLIIEKIKGSPVNQKFENWCHTIGFILLMLLILYVTIHDVINLF
jgi:regulator of sigma E protease